MDTKDSKRKLLIPVIILYIFFIIIQFAMFLLSRGPIWNGFSFMRSILGTILLSFVAPITFIGITFYLRNEEKPKRSILKTSLLVVGIAIINLVLSIVITMQLEKIYGPTTGNPVISEAKKALLPTVFRLGWGLLGEEAIKLSFFFVLYGKIKYDSDKKWKYWGVWIIIAIVFGLGHFDTYKYNLLHSILAIGLPNVLYGYLWKKTESPVLMWSTHFLYDMILVLITYIAM